MATQEYPALVDETLESVCTVLMAIIRLRSEDVSEFANLPNVFIRGRKVGKIPTGSADVAITDRVGDFNYDVDYIYILVDNSGTAEWRRAALGSW